MPGEAPAGDILDDRKSAERAVGGLQERACRCRRVLGTLFGDP